MVAINGKACPLKMTDAGQFLFKCSGAADALTEMSGVLLMEMDGAELRTEYDVEQRALELLLRNMGHEALDGVKRFVYFSPDKVTVEGTGEAVRFDFYAIVRLMGIELRDMYLAAHPEIGGS